MIRLYRNVLSGHCHRVELFLSLLGLPFEKVELNFLENEHKAPAFLALNPLGQIPVLQDGEVTLADANAILVYLEACHAPGQWLPRDPLGAARVQRWLSLAAGPLAFGPAMARAIQIFSRPMDPQPAMERAHGLLAFMESELAATGWLAGSKATLADVAHYAYVARAPEGGVSLKAYPAVRAWTKRVEALPGFVPMLKTPVGLAE